MTTQIEKIVMELVCSKGWTTEKEVFERLRLLPWGTQVAKEKQFKKILGEMLDKYPLVRTWLTKELKKQLKADIKGYPLVIIKQEQPKVRSISSIFIELAIMSGKLFETEVKMVVLVIYGFYKKYFDPEFKDLIVRYLVEYHNCPELLETLETHSQKEFDKVYHKYHLKGKLFIQLDGSFNTSGVNAKVLKMLSSFVVF